MKKLDKDIINDYKKGYSTRELASKYGFKTKKSILDRLHKYNIEVRTTREHYDLRYEYRSFSMARIDTKLKAYYLGLMLSDGYIVGDEIGISLTDKDCIAFLSQQIGKNYNIIDKGENRKTQYRITMKNRRIKKELERFSVIERKSHIIKAPKLYKSEHQFIHYIIRGLIDGDGWIRKDGKEFFICTMSCEFAKWIKYILENYLFMEDVNLLQAEDGIYFVRSANKKNINILKAIVYDTPYGMARKYNLLYADVQRL